MQKEVYKKGQYKIIQTELGLTVQDKKGSYVYRPEIIKEYKLKQK